jgi:hypothetical protein
VSTKLRDCAVCKNPVLDRPYQDKKARTCQPSCARALAHKEHPELHSSKLRRMEQMLPS